MGTRRHWHMGLLANVIKHASDVEHFLDLYRARNNRNWIYFRELTATIKNFGKAGFLLEEIKKSVKAELLFPDEETLFVTRVGKGIRFLTDIITKAFLETPDRGKKTGASSVLRSGSSRQHRGELPGEIILPHTIEEASTSEMALTARKIASRFADVAEKIQPLEEVVRFQGSKLETVIPYKINEGTAQGARHPPAQPPVLVRHLCFKPQYRGGIPRAQGASVHPFVPTESV